MGTCASSSAADCTEVVVFPPFPFISIVVDDLAGVGVGVGAQSIFHTAESGAYTGAVSASMVTSLGCQYVLCGHSERRTVFKDDDEAINKKVLKVIEDGMRRSYASARRKRSTTRASAPTSANCSSPRTW